MYRQLLKLLTDAPDCRVMLLSGTPVFDKVNEIALIGNLLEPDKSKHMPTKIKDFMNRYFSSVLGDATQEFV